VSTSSRREPSVDNNEDQAEAVLELLRSGIIVGGRRWALLHSGKYDQAGYDDKHAEEYTAE
jgi:hypothetical protein